MESVSIIRDSPPVKIGKNKNIKRLTLLIFILYLAFLVYIVFYALHSYAIELGKINYNQAEIYDEYQ